MRIATMDDGIGVETKVIKMGATGIPASAHLAALQERKKSIEETLAKYNEELKQLCIQEADLTGEIPKEMPLEPSTNPGRCVGTSYQLPASLVKNSNNKDETIAKLELQIEFHTKMAEAALELASKPNASKALKRQHLLEYQVHKQKFSELQDKLTGFKEKSQQNDIQKQKKKPRPSEQDDNISMGTTMTEPFAKSELRHSMISHKTDDYPSASYPRMYKNSSSAYVDNTFPRHEDPINRGLYRLSISGYKNYMEKHESTANMHISPYNTLQYSPTHSSQMTLSQHPPLSTQYSQPYQLSRSSQILYNNYPYNTIAAPMKNYPSPPNVPPNSRLHRQSSPHTNPKILYHPSPEPYRYSEMEPALHPHQIQPHQQYEQMTLGLGGYWTRLENGEMVWCTDSSIQRDKRFGSLDRRKQKRVNKRISPNVDPKSATLASVPTYSDHVRHAAIKSPQVITRRREDNRQLVRTQSLGSVGAQTVDSVWPSDDNSSEGDNRSINDPSQSLRRQKRKEWVETSLDGPVSPTHSIISRSQSALPSVLSPEEKYILPPVPPPLTPKPPLEIPAESNPSPRLPETNIELYNNNIPKNCTVVQAGHCKPYHEETKPFEMSDFYKYSTKFKKSPVKPPVEKPPIRGYPKNLNETFDNNTAGLNHNFSPTQSSPVRLLDNSNTSLNLSQIANANVAEGFSDEMNAWYTNSQFQLDSASSSSKSKSTATLV